MLYLLCFKGLKLTNKQLCWVWHELSLSRSFDGSSEGRGGWGWGPGLGVRIVMKYLEVTPKYLHIGK